MMENIYILILILVWAFIIIWTKVEFNHAKYLKEVCMSAKGGPLLITYLMKGDYRNNLEIPHYKFFSRLITELVKARKLYGCEIEKTILEVRKYLRIDVKETKRIKESIYGGAFQYIMISMFTWGFLICTKEMIHIEISLIEEVSLICFQLLGLALYFYIAKVIEFKSFNILNTYFYTIYNFRTLFMISRPVSEIISSLKIDKLPANKDLVHVKDRMFILIKELKSKGSMNNEDLNQLVYEAWDCFELKLERFFKFITVLKLLAMALFVLPSFLAVMFLLMSKLHV